MKRDTWMDDQLDMWKNHYDALRCAAANHKLLELDVMKQRSQPELAKELLEAYKLLHEIEHRYGYEIAMFEQHAGAIKHTQCGYVLGCIRNDGHFNKWSKAIGGHLTESGPLGDYLCFEDKKDAEAALLHIEPAVAQYIRIFPVVLTAGNDPDA